MAATMRLHAIGLMKHGGRSSMGKLSAMARILPAVSTGSNNLHQVRYGGNRPATSQVPNMMDIGCRSIFEEHHDQFRESVRKFFQNEVLPPHEKYEAQGRVDRELWEKAGTQGLLGVAVSDSVGGIGGDFQSTAIVMEEQAYVNCSGPGFGLHSDIVMPYLEKYGTKEQQEKFLPRMTAGTCIGALAMSEPAAGSDVQGFRTHAKKDGDDWILNGSKVFITNGINSDLVIVVARTDPNAKSQAHGTTLFLVEEGMPGFKKGKNLKKVGLKAQDTSELFFEDVRLPSNAILGELNKGFYYLMGELPRERLLIAIMAVASCEWVFEETKKYCIERKAFNKRLVDMQTINHKLAELKSEICVARVFTDHCIALQNEGTLDSVTASMAKYITSDLQNRVAYECLQLHGGWGYMWEYPVAKAFVDARVQPIYGGTNEIMKELIARTVMK